MRIAGAAALLLGAAYPAVGVTLYSTSFDDPPFTTTTRFWAGVDGWASTDPSSGTAAVTSDGGAVYLGFVPPATPTSPAAAWRALNLDPVAMGLPIVRMTSRIAIQDSTNSKYDLFAFVIYNQAGKALSGFFMDNAGLQFGYDDTSGIQTVAGTLPNNAFFTIVQTVNMSTNRTSAQFIRPDGVTVPLFTNRVYSSGGGALNLGEFDYVWFLNSSTAPGDNAMIIDALSIEGFPNPTLTLAKNGVQKTRSTSYTLRGGQAAEDDVQVQWRTREHKRWSAVRGTSAQWLLKLKNLKPGRNAVELRLLDALGREIHRKSVVVLRK